MATGRVITGAGSWSMSKGFKDYFTCCLKSGASANGRSSTPPIGEDAADGKAPSDDTDQKTSELTAAELEGKLAGGKKVRMTSQTSNMSTGTELSLTTVEGGQLGGADPGSMKQSLESLLLVAKTRSRRGGGSTRNESPYPQGDVTSRSGSLQSQRLYRGWFLSPL